MFKEKTNECSDFGEIRGLYLHGNNLIDLYISTFLFKTQNKKTYYFFYIK